MGVFVKGIQYLFSLHFSPTIVCMMPGTVESIDYADPLPLVLMHYMPWFQYAGYHWKEDLDWDTLFQDRRIASHYTPIIGPYDSVDRDVVRYHLELMKAAGVAGIVVDWYGTRSFNDYVPNLRAADAIIEEASVMGMLFTVCYEDYTLVAGDDVAWGEEPAGETLIAARERLRLDMAYIRDNYASKPGFLREGKQVTTVDVEAESEQFSQYEDFGIVLCPYMEASQYCDCEGDCTGLPEYCTCDEAQHCCSHAAPTVTCPGQSPENYCDCDGDCTHKSEWCQCPDAKACCGESDDGQPGNRPVMLVFGPRNMKTGAEWTDAMSEVFTDVHDRPKLLTLHNGGAPPEVGDGTFSWFPPMKPEANLGTQEEVLTGVHEYFREFYAQNEGTLHIGSVFPGFHDYYQQGRNQPSYGRLPEYGGHTFEAAMYQARTHRPAFIQAATWNDWEEGTAIEPREDDEDDGGTYYFLLKLQQHILGVQRPDDFTAIFEAYKAKKGVEFGWTETDA